MTDNCRSSSLSRLYLILELKIIPSSTKKCLWKYYIFPEISFTGKGGGCRGGWDFSNSLDNINVNICILHSA